MTQRKPPGVTWESWIDRQIRVGMEQGAFDDLPGAGKPVDDLDQPRDELWWVRAKLRRENIEYLPPTLQVRKEFDAALDDIAVADSEAAVRAIVERINGRVRWVNSRVTAGPPSSVAPLDADAEVRRWREGPAGRAAATPAAAVPAGRCREGERDREGGGDRERGPDPDGGRPAASRAGRRRWPFARRR